MFSTMSRNICHYFRQNTVFFVGLCIGISLSLIVTPFMEDECFFSIKNPKGSYSEHVSKRRSLSSDSEKDDFEPQINFAGKPKKASKTPQSLLRPRYYSTELGIREKLFVGVLTSKQNIHSRAVAINKTVSDTVNKIMFFIDSPGPQKLNISMPGILGFSDTRKILKPFHAIKYILDNLLDEFDFFYLVNDRTYIKARKLLSIVEKISVSKEVHMGDGRDSNQSPFCSLNAGLLLSHSVMEKIRGGLDWCVKNAFSDSDDDNVGRCILHSSGIPCSQNLFGEKYGSLHLDDDFDIERDLWQFTNSDKFQEAVSIFPVPNARTTYKLHAYFTRVELEANEQEIKRFKELIIEGEKNKLMPSNGSRTQSNIWPVGSQPGSQPNSRFDLLPWDYFTTSSLYPDSDFSSSRLLRGAELADIQYIINTTALYAEEQYQGRLRFRRLVNGYRRFDPSRGMDYILDLTFRNTSSGLEVQKRFEVAKPLGSSEIVPMPYVTENTRVTILLPISANNANWALEFIRAYSQSSSGGTGMGAWARSTYLLLALLYDPLLPGKGHKDDVFGKVKSEALAIAGALRSMQSGSSGGSGIAWVSLKSPSAGVQVPEFAIIDMAVKKVNQDSLMLYTRPNAIFHLDFMNRVRMNTILGWQVFSPIPFAEYHPDIVYTGPDFVTRPAELDVNKSYGHFDNLDTNHLSFYVKDYLIARKMIENSVPIVRADKDLAHGYGKPTEEYPSLYSMFVKASDLHILREALADKNQKNRLDSPLSPSCEPSLPAKTFAECIHHADWALGTRAQLGILLLQYREHKKWKNDFVEAFQFPVRK
ncbi:hypothetical protein J437_LFUL004920 [Ladona fulva]|uniref:Hexosyltransferase n=1 Tax=Ladona fulva TaxID=123851 RepID=A0A8K0K8J0_LADFU|nr:hypothetical protein J437_LFUL004920 [Ladona fulva]